MNETAAQAAPLSREIARNAQLAAIVSSSGDAIISLSKDWSVLTWNPGAEKMFGFSEAEAIGRKIEQLIIPREKSDERDQVFQTVINDKRPLITESVRRHKNGRLVEVEINSAPMFNSDGEVFAASIVYRDVSRRNAASRRALAHARRLADIKGALSIGTDGRGGKSAESSSDALPETTSITAPMPLDDPKRLAEIEAAGLTGKDTDTSFDRFTALARQVVDAPMALLSIVLPDRQVFISTSGLFGELEGIRETSISQSYCQNVVTSGAPLVINDAASNELVQACGLAEHGLVAYLGVPIVTREGHVLGSFCVLDNEERQWTRDELATLQGLAALVMRRIENRILIQQLEQEMEVRTETESRLRESEERMRMAARAANIGFWELDLETNTFVATAEDFAHYGLPHTTDPVHVDDFVRPLYFPEDRERIQAEIDESIRTGERLVQQKRIRRPNGEVRWLEVITEVRQDSDGKPVSRFGATLDITAVKRAQDELAASEDRFRRMTDNVPLIIWMHGPNGEQEFVNQTYCDYFGVSREEMRDDRWQLLTHPDDGTAYADAFAAAVQARAPFNEEIRVKVGNGEWRSLESWAQPHFSADGTYLGHIGASVDVTESKAWQDMLETSTHRLRKVVETAQVGIGFGNFDGKLTGANKALLELLGRTEDELVRGHINWRDHRRTEDAFVVERSAAQVAREGQAPPFETTLLDTNETEVPVLVSSSMINPESSEHVAFVVDLTQQKQHEMQIQLLMQEVNHRSKNLLAVVQSIARQTARDADPKNFTSDFVKRLQGLSRSQDLIIAGDWTAVGLSDLVGTQLHFLGSILDERLAISGPQVRLSPAAAQGIGMALHELATNALKYGALSVPSGKIEISWRFTDLEGQDDLEIQWIESHGPPVTKPEREGFGQTVIEHMAAYSVGGTVDLQYEPSGLKWKLTASAAEIAFGARPTAN